MPMKNTGRAPVTKAQKHEIQEKNKTDQRDGKAIAAKVSEDKPESNDPRTAGR